MTRFALRPTAALALTLLGSPLASDAAAQVASPASTKSTTLRSQAALAGPQATTRVMRAGTPEPPEPPPGATTTRTIQPDGTIVIKYANGRTRFVLANGGTSLVGRDGKVIPEYSLRSSVQTLDPVPPKDQKVSHWFEQHAADLLDALMSVVVGDRAAVRSRYLKREPSGLTIYQKIDSRTRDLARLVEP